MATGNRVRNDASVSLESSRNYGVGALVLLRDPQGIRKLGVALRASFQSVQRTCAYAEKSACSDGEAHARCFCQSQIVLQS